jgi:hypothetical protein
MLFNYFKIAFRNLVKYKGFSTINILGLAVGMASAILIFLWISHEVSYDQFHEKKDRIYEAWNKGSFNGKISCWNTTPKVLASAIQADLPEIETTTRVNWTETYLTRFGDKTIMMSRFDYIHFVHGLIWIGNLYGSYPFQRNWHPESIGRLRCIYNNFIVQRFPETRTDLFHRSITNSMDTNERMVESVCL